MRRMINEEKEEKQSEEGDCFMMIRDQEVSVIRNEKV